MPHWLISLRLRLRAIIGRHQLEQDLHDEMAFHLAMREEKQRQAGVPADQARVMARRQFGNVGVLKHRARDVWIWPWLQDTEQDVRFAARLLYRARGSTLLAVLCLGWPLVPTRRSSPLSTRCCCDRSRSSSRTG